MTRRGDRQEGRATPYVYVLGAGHSGSTLLASLLGLHPSVCTVGEVKYLDRIDPKAYRCSCGTTLDRCDFWQALQTTLLGAAPPARLFEDPSDIRRPRDPYSRYLMTALHRGPLFEWMRDRALELSPSWRLHRDRVEWFTATLAQGVCEAYGRPIFVDSSKSALPLKQHLRSSRLSVRVVHLVRDARGVALSYRRADGLPLQDGAYAWKRSNEEAAHVLRTVPCDLSITIRYEDLCADTDATLCRLFHFLGVAPISFDGLTAARTQHMLGNDRMRSASQRIRTDERWRQELSVGELRTIDIVSASLNRRFGYR